MITRLAIIVIQRRRCPVTGGIIASPEAVVVDIDGVYKKNRTSIYKVNRTDKTCKRAVVNERVYLWSGLRRDAICIGVCVRVCGYKFFWWQCVCMCACVYASLYRVRGYRTCSLPWYRIALPRSKFLLCFFLFPFFIFPLVHLHFYFFPFPPSPWYIYIFIFTPFVSFILFRCRLRFVSEDGSTKFEISLLEENWHFPSPISFPLKRHDMYTIYKKRWPVCLFNYFISPFRWRRGFFWGVAQWFSTPFSVPTDRAWILHADWLWLPSMNVRGSRNFV